MVPSRIRAAVNVASPGDRRRIVVAAGAVDEQREEDLRRAMILDHDEVDAVREIRLLRLRQLDLQHLLVDRRLALQDRARLLGRVALRRRRRQPGRRARAPSAQTATMAIDGASLRTSLRPAAAFGIVITTERFSLVRYFFATRCTSAAVTFLSLSARVLIRLGLSKNSAYSPSWMARCSVLVTAAACCRTRAVVRLLDLPVRNRAGLHLLDLLVDRRFDVGERSCPARPCADTWNSPGPRLSAIAGAGARTPAASARTTFSYSRELRPLDSTRDSTSSASSSGEPAGGAMPRDVDPRQPRQRILDRAAALGGLRRLGEVDRRFGGGCDGIALEVLLASASSVFVVSTSPTIDSTALFGA